MPNIAKIAIEKATYSFDKLYSYRVPCEMLEALKPGCRVIIPFGNGGRKVQGIVMEVEVKEEALEEPVNAVVQAKSKPLLKTVITLIDSTPLLNSEQLELVQYLRRNTFCTYYDAVKVLIPAGIGVRLRTLCTLNTNNNKAPLPHNLSPQEKQIIAYLQKKKKAVRLEVMQSDLELLKNAPAIKHLMESQILILSEDAQSKAADGKIIMVKMAPAYEDPEINILGLSAGQKSVVSVLRENGCASMKEVCYYAGVTQAVVKNLEKKQIVELFGRQIFRNPYEQQDDDNHNKAPHVSPAIDLTPGQQLAFEELRNIEKSNEQSPVALLYGVTGSGKTRVFLKLIEEVRRKGRTAVVLVPEISLTPQTMELFRIQFGGRVAVLHSGLTMVERADEYKRICQKHADVVVGTRSAVFAPLENIGLIVIDEEQEHTYRSEQTPKFHAREVARFRCRKHKALLVLASATPSVESFYKAKHGQYHLVELSQRYQGRDLPQVEMVDMTRQFDTEISTRLAEEITCNIHNGQQSVLLMNRRGYQTIIKCQECGEVATCPNCSVALTYHRANGKLMCHYCGYTRELVEKCDNCGSPKVRYVGSGTQKIEELFEQVFPNTNILRMDMDTTMARFSHETKFAAFANGEYQVMLGTQMVAKGLNFPNVTLVGVLNADQYLYAQDFRGCEKTFSLITQVVGRCGRGELPGRALIQTCSPDHPVIKQAAKQDYKGFFEDEIKARKLGLYPPFCDLCLVAFSGIHQEHVRKAAERFFADFCKSAAKDFPRLPLRILEPCPPSVDKVAGKYRYHLIIKCRKGEIFSRLMWSMLQNFCSDGHNKDINISVDMNYDGSL